jgi:hypothetical protein
MEMDAGNEGCGSGGSGSHQWRVGVEVEEIHEDEEQIYFISSDLVVDDVGGEENHGDDTGDNKIGLSLQGDTHPGTLNYSLLPFYRVYKKSQAFH